MRCMFQDTHRRRGSSKKMRLRSFFRDTNHILHLTTARSRLSAPELTPGFCTGLCPQKRGYRRDAGLRRGGKRWLWGKCACGIHQNGRWYTEENIDQMLMERHLAKRRDGTGAKHHLKGPAKEQKRTMRIFSVPYLLIDEVSDSQ